MKDERIWLLASCVIEEDEFNEPVTSVVYFPLIFGISISLENEADRFVTGVFFSLLVGVITSSFVGDENNCRFGASVSTVRIGLNVLTSATGKKILVFDSLLTTFPESFEEELEAKL